MSTDAFVRTTVVLREDFYQRLKSDPSGLSRALNDILSKEFRRDHSLFGTSKTRDRGDLRDKKDRF